MQHIGACGQALVREEPHALDRPEQHRRHLVARRPRGGALSRRGQGEDAAPFITDLIIAPSSLSYEGGTVTVTATVTDDTGVDVVWADYTGESYGGIDMVNTGGDTYEGTFEAPQNGNAIPSATSSRSTQRT